MQCTLCTDADLTKSSGASIRKDSDQIMPPQSSHSFPRSAMNKKHSVASILSSNTVSGDSECNDSATSLSSEDEKESQPDSCKREREVLQPAERSITTEDESAEIIPRTGKITLHNNHDII